MRVVVYCDCDSRGGVWVYSIGLIESLRLCGHEVHAISHQPADGLQRLLSEQISNSANRLWLIRSDIANGRVVNEMSQLLVQINPQVVIPNYRLLPYAATMLASRRLGFVTVGVCHNDHESYYQLLSRYQQGICVFVAPCESVARNLRALLPARANDVAMIPHGIRRPERACAGFAGGTLKLIYHGRLVDEQKQVSIMLDVVERVLKMGVPCELALVGDGPQTQVYKERIAGSVLRGAVTVVPGEDWPQLVERLLGAHVGLLTSKYEGFCFSLAEAMGCGLPGVSFRCGGVVEDYLEHDVNGLLVDSGDVNGMASAIVQIQRDPRMWARLGEAARKTIGDRFSWPAAGRNYSGVFEAFVEKGACSRWPAYRPAWIPEGGRSLGSLLERGGRAMGIWK